MVLFFLFFQGYAYSKSVTLTKEYSLYQDTTKVLKKVKGKLGFIKKLFHHSDSAKLARKFIHQHHKELKEKQSPTFVTDTDTVKLKNIVFKTKKKCVSNLVTEWTRTMTTLLFSLMMFLIFFSS